MEKRKRAEERCLARLHGQAASPLCLPNEGGAAINEPAGVDVSDVDEELSDEEDVGQEEWRTVVAGGESSSPTSHRCLAVIVY